MSHHVLQHSLLFLLTYVHFILYFLYHILYFLVFHIDHLLNSLSLTWYTILLQHAYLNHSPDVAVVLHLLPPLLRLTPISIGIFHKMTIYWDFPRFLTFTENNVMSKAVWWQRRAIYGFNLQQKSQQIDHFLYFMNFIIKMSISISPNSCSACASLTLCAFIHTNDFTGIWEVKTGIVESTVCVEPLQSRN